MEVAGSLINISQHEILEETYRKFLSEAEKAILCPDLSRYRKTQEHAVHTSQINISSSNLKKKSTPFKLKSTERYGSSHRKGHGTTQFLHRGKRGRQKENSKELHQFTRMQPLAGTQNGNARSSYQKEILSV